MKHRAFARPEDAAHWKGVVGDHEQAERFQCALRNDLENIPWFIILLAAMLALRGDPVFGLYYGCAFVIARVLHTWAFVNSRQPLRNRAYLFGVGVTLAVVAHCAVLWLRGLAF